VPSASSHWPVVQSPLPDQNSVGWTMTDPVPVTAPAGWNRAWRPEFPPKALVPPEYVFRPASTAVPVPTFSNAALSAQVRKHGAAWRLHERIGLQTAIDDAPARPTSTVVTTAVAPPRSQNAAVDHQRRPRGQGRAVLKLQHPFTDGRGIGVGIGPAQQERAAPILTTASPSISQSIVAVPTATSILLPRPCSERGRGEAEGSSCCPPPQTRPQEKRHSAHGPPGRER